MTKRTRWIGLLIFIVVCLGAGGLGAIATTPEIEGWYATIEKPSWSPPDYVFGPVWTTLFVMLAFVATTVVFFRRSKIAGWLMVPYLAWVSFASVLNFTIWRLNP